MQLSSVVTNHLPDNIQQNYPLFMQFITDYYKFMETGVGSPQYILQNMLNIIETDSNQDEFYNSMFRKIYPEGIPSTIAIDPKLLSKAMQQLYQTKGSEKSYSILFRILFGTAIEIYYPKFRMIRVSDGKWVQEQSIMVTINSGDITDIPSRLINCINKSGSINSKIVRYTKLNNGIYEIFIDAVNQNISFIYGDKITVPGTDLVATVQRTITNCKVKNGGLGFRVGQLFSISDNNGTGTVVKVKKVSSLGAIERVTIVGFGNGFTVPFYATIKSPVTMSDMSNPFSTYTNGFIESGSLTDSAGNIRAKFFDDSSIIEGGQIDTSKTAILSVEIGTLCNYPGYYSVTDGMTSDYGVLQDGNLFQEYSYLIKSEIPVDQYRNAVQTILHPAGTKMFGEYNIVNDLDLGVALELVRDIVRAIAVTDDYSTPSDSYFFVNTKVLSETITSTDQTIFNLTKVIPTDTVLNTDNGSIGISNYVVSGYIVDDYIVDFITTF